jgi:hypothetical protein
MLVLRLTLVLLVLQPVPGWVFRPLTILLAILGLLFPAVLRTPALWGALLGVAIGRLILDWPLPDNHNYLLAYWILAIFLALVVARPDATLRVSARWLVGFVFLWATLWKGLLSPDYMDERFFRVRLATDERFAAITQLVGRISEEELSQRRQYLEPPPDEPLPTQGPVPAESPHLARMATFLTWFTVVFEGAVAVAFLFSWGRWTHLFRHGLLLGFCAGIFAIIPVSGFGWLLAILGIAQVGERGVWLRASYLVAWFLILLFHQLPWARFLLDAGVGRIS